MVLYRNHLDALSGDPKVVPTANGDATPVIVTGHSPRLSSSSSTKRAIAAVSSKTQTNSDRAHLLSAYDVTLLVRSRNPVGDAHDPNLESHEIPSHHVPSIVSVASKTFRQRRSKKDRARETAKRAAEVMRPASRMGIASETHRRGSAGRRFAQPAADQRDFSSSHLPLLSFQNPWDSFKPPSLTGVWRGLRWGLPTEYEEGGHSKYRGSGRKARQASEEYRTSETQLGKDWAHIDVNRPSWGWVDSDRCAWLQGPTVEREKAEEADPYNPASSHDRFGKRKEWQDPRAGEAYDCARVTWLGHASTLLQLPPLAHPSTYQRDATTEQIPGTTEGDIVEFHSEEKAREIMRHFTGRQDDQKHRHVMVQEDKPLKKAKAARNRRNGLLAPSDTHPNDKIDRTKDDDDQDSTTGESVVLDDIRDRSINILFDPVFSKRCSPSQTVGPVRFTEAPCQADELPPVDVIILSHDHYDHADVESLRKIRTQRGHAVHVFAGLGNRDWLCNSAGFKKSQVSELDWWDEAILTASGTENCSRDESKAAIRIICTPAQHGSGRVPGGKDSTLWASWVIERICPPEPSHAVEKKSGVGQTRWRAFFAGDTGLRRHGERVTNRKSPVCPAFEEIARRYGTPHLFILPISIGSSLSYLRSKDPFPRRYSPFPRVSESLTSSIHMDAEDAVQMMEIMTGFRPKDRPEDAGPGAAGPLALAVHVSKRCHDEKTPCVEKDGRTY